MEKIVLALERGSERTLEACRREGRRNQLLDDLRAFKGAASELRKEFRRATGTGFRGTWSKMRGRQGDLEALRAKLSDLEKRAGEIDGLIGSSSATTQDYWREVRSNLRRLSGYF